MSAPVIVVVGLAAIFWGGRAVAFGGRAHRWADSLDKGSGPVRLDIPFVPIFVSGARVGSLDTVVVQRHRRGVVDSLRIVVKPLASANAERLAACAYHLQSLDQFDPTEYPRALTCAADTAGLARFGRVAFGGGHEAPLFVDADQLACEELVVTPDVPDAVEPVVARAVATSVSKSVSKTVAQEVSQAVATSVANGTATSVDQTVQATGKACTQRALTRAQSRWRQQGISRTEIQRMVRQARDQARLAQEQGRQAREQARQAVEQARQAAATVKH